MSANLFLMGGLGLLSGVRHPVALLRAASIHFRRHSSALFCTRSGVTERAHRLPLSVWPSCRLILAFARRMGCFESRVPWFESQLMPVQAETEDSQTIWVFWADWDSNPGKLALQASAVAAVPSAHNLKLHAPDRIRTCDP